MSLREDLEDATAELEALLPELQEKQARYLRLSIEVMEMERKLASMFGGGQGT